MVSTYLSCRALLMYKHRFVLISTRIIELPTLTFLTPHRFRQIDMGGVTVKAEQNNRYDNENTKQIFKALCNIKGFHNGVTQGSSLIGYDLCVAGRTRLDVSEDISAFLLKLKDNKKKYTVRL